MVETLTDKDGGTVHPDDCYDIHLRTIFRSKTLPKNIPFSLSSLSLSLRSLFLSLPLARAYHESKSVQVDGISRPNVLRAISRAGSREGLSKAATSSIAQAILLIPASDSCF